MNCDSSYEYLTDLFAHRNSPQQKGLFPQPAGVV